MSSSPAVVSMPASGSKTKRVTSVPRPWTLEEDRIICQLLAMPNMSLRRACHEAAARLSNRTPRAVELRYRKHILPRLRNDILRLAEEHGRPIPCQVLDNLATRYGLSPIWLNAFWGRICAADPSLKTLAFVGDNGVSSVPAGDPNLLKLLRSLGDTVPVLFRTWNLPQGTEVTIHHSDISLSAQLLDNGNVRVVADLCPAS